MILNSLNLVYEIKTRDRIQAEFLISTTLLKGAACFSAQAPVPRKAIKRRETLFMNCKFTFSIDSYNLVKSFIPASACFCLLSSVSASNVLFPFHLLFSFRLRFPAALIALDFEQYR